MAWFSEIRKRITSSNVRSISKQKSTTPVACMVNRMLYSTFSGKSATKYGLEQEEYSVSVYTSWLHDRSRPNAIINIKCGLVVCTAHPWLAATPDGWVTDPQASPSQGFVEFRNPYSYRDLAMSDATAAKKCDCLAINNSRIELKHTHSYYYQIQMTMFCTKKDVAIFFFAPLLTINVNKTSSMNLFVVWFFPFCSASTFWRSGLNLP